MATTALAASTLAIDATLGRLHGPSRSRQWSGDVILGIFLLTQLLDGFCTYQGVRLFGIDVEANPLVAGLMIHLGHGPGLLIAKILASGFGICLYIRRIHAVVALLAGIYMTAAIAPWTAILFF